MATVTELLGALGGRYIDARYGQESVQDPFVPYISPIPLSAHYAGPNLPFVDIIPEANGTCNPTKGMVWNPNANCGAGKWQKRSRRRRKRLASLGDLKDLASLKGVLGQGKAFEVWIATHS